MCQLAQEPAPDDLSIERAALLGSFLLFMRVFFKIITNRDFIVPEPPGRESHVHIIVRELEECFIGKTSNLVINVPPRYGKSELVKYFIAWALAQYPDSNFLYISYSHELAAKHTYGIRRIIETKHYRELFAVTIASDSSAKDNFKTNFGGSVVALGLSGSITGQDAGIPFLDRFSGGVFIDDAHKPDDVHSDTIRRSVINNYIETIQPRVFGRILECFIGQRLHEDDLANFLINGKDGRHRKKVILQALDANMNPLNPGVHSRQDLIRMRDNSPYVFSSQMQQDPQPAGGGIFRPEWIVQMDEYPEVFVTFIVADTAETSKTYNDATVFSFFGLYKIKQEVIDTGILGLHWIDCDEVWVEPKDLKPAFLDFYARCMRFPVQPKMAAIEKKSTGATLLSVLEVFQGIEIIDIQRNAGSGSKTTRFLECQPYVASKQVSINANASHLTNCIEHIRKITSNNTHARDDIADTLCDGIKIGLIDKIATNFSATNEALASMAPKIMSKFHSRKRGLSQWQ